MDVWGDFTDDGGFTISVSCKILVVRAGCVTAAACDRTPVEVVKGDGERVSAAAEALIPGTVLRKGRKKTELLPDDRIGLETTTAAGSAVEKVLGGDDSIRTTVAVAEPGGVINGFLCNQAPIPITPEV